MEEIFIPPENHSPRVEFYSSGTLLLEGRSMPEDAIELFKPLLTFASNIKTRKVNFDINLEYFNTTTSKKILQLLRILDNNKNIEELNVIWHYEKGDLDSVEIAEIFDESLLNTRFYYSEHKELIVLSKHNFTLES